MRGLSWRSSNSGPIFRAVGLVVRAVGGERRRILALKVIRIGSRRRSRRLRIWEREEGKTRGTGHLSISSFSTMEAQQTEKEKIQIIRLAECLIHSKLFFLDSSSIANGQAMKSEKETVRGRCLSTAFLLPSILLKCLPGARGERRNFHHTKRQISMPSPPLTTLCFTARTHAR